jgi:hypothetical protein
MARPGLKYPTNHHLSQILERWTVNAAYQRAGWSVEAGIFGGQEPEGPYDFSNLESFGDSWSGRVARRWGSAATPDAVWEASISVGSVTEFAHTVEETTRFGNLAVTRTAPLGGGELYGLAEASRSFIADHDDFFSLLAEARWNGGGHQPYARVEYAARPEYARKGLAGDDAFFLYEHDTDPIGTTRWLIATAAYALELTPSPWSVRPFVEVQHHQVRADTGPVTATDLYGRTSFWALSLGARIFIGGEPMRMGSYGALDSMTEMGMQSKEAAAAHVH